MVVALTLVPLWVVLLAAGAGRTMDGAVAGRSATRRGRRRRAARARRKRAGASAPADAARRADGVARRSARVGLVVAASPRGSRRDGDPYGALPITRAQAESAGARRSCSSAASTLAPKWRVMAVPDDGSGGPHQFVIETAGEAALARAARRLPAQAALARARRDVRRRRRRSRRRVADVRDRRPARSANVRHIAARSAAGRVARRRRGAAARAGRGQGSRSGSTPAQLKEVSAQAAEAEGAHRLDVHLRRHDDRAAAAGRAAHRRRPRRRRSRVGRRATSTCPRSGSASSAPRRRATSSSRSPIVDRLRRPAARPPRSAA